jgi:short-subunit dehydrogenase
LKAKDNVVYGLVNNAGYVEPGAVEDITMNDLRNQFESNFFGLVGFTKKVLPIMMMQHRNGQRIEGRIVNISSLAGLISLPLIGSYSATRIMKIDEEKIRILIYEVSRENWGNTGILGVDMK